MALGFYKMMMTNGAGEKISKIELIDLTPEEDERGRRRARWTGRDENAPAAQADEEA